MEPARRDRGQAAAFEEKQDQLLLLSYDNPGRGLVQRTRQKSHGLVRGRRALVLVLSPALLRSVQGKPGKPASAEANRAGLRRGRQ